MTQITQKITSAGCLHSHLSLNSQRGERVMATRQTNQANIEQLIADEFGVNADYVLELLQQFERAPGSIDEEWRQFFDDLLTNGSISTEGLRQKPPTKTSRKSAVPPGTREQPATLSGVTQPTYEWGRDAQATPTAKPEQQASPAVSPAIPKIQPESPDGEPIERVPIRGPALRIAENMEASLTVPTATSQRQIPIKLLDENRRVINQHRASVDQSKISFTHLVAWAILESLDDFPRLNDAYDSSGSAPSRIRREHVNFGLAVDVTKSDGSRTL